MPPAMSPRSISNVLREPSPASWNSVDAPITPPPMTIASNVSLIRSTPSFHHSVPRVARAQPRSFRRGHEAAIGEGHEPFPQFAVHLPAVLQDALPFPR